MIDFNQLQTGTKVLARFAKGDNLEGDAPNWEQPKVVTLYVQKTEKDYKKGKVFRPAGTIVCLTPQDFAWAEYGAEDYNVEYNEFTCEEYRMQILEIK